MWVAQKSLVQQLRVWANLGGRVQPSAGVVEVDVGVIVKPRILACAQGLEVREVDGRIGAVESFTSNV